MQRKKSRSRSRAYYSKERPIDTIRADLDDDHEICVKVRRYVKNNEEAQFFLSEQNRYCENNFDTDTQEAFKNYKTSQFSFINNFARGKITIDNELHYYHAKKTIDLIDFVLLNAPRFPFPVYSHRLIPITGNIFKMLADNAYKSTSFDPEICFNFKKNSRMLFLQIKIFPGNPIFFYESCFFHDMPSESEILLGRNVTFQPVKSYNKIILEYNDFLNSDKQIFYLDVTAVYNEFVPFDT